MANETPPTPTEDLPQPPQDSQHQLAQLRAYVVTTMDLTKDPIVRDRLRTISSELTQISEARDAWIAGVWEAAWVVAWEKAAARAYHAEIQQADVWAGETLPVLPQPGQEIGVASLAQITLTLEWISRKMTILYGQHAAGQHLDAQDHETGHRETPYREREREREHARRKRVNHQEQRLTRALVRQISQWAENWAAEMEDC